MIDDDYDDESLPVWSNCWPAHIDLSYFLYDSLFLSYFLWKFFYIDLPLKIIAALRSSIVHFVVFDALSPCVNWAATGRRLSSVRHLIRVILWTPFSQIAALTFRTFLCGCRVSKHTPLGWRVFTLSFIHPSAGSSRMYRECQSGRAMDSPAWTRLSD